MGPPLKRWAILRRPYGAPGQQIISRARLMTDWHRFAYSAFMLLSMGVFLIARRCMPRPAGLARLAWWQRGCITLAGFVGGALGGKLPFVFTGTGGVLSWTAW